MRKFFKKVFTIVNLLILLILVILTTITAILISQKDNKQETRSRAAVNIPPIITSKDRKWGVGGDRYRAGLLGAGSYYGWGRDTGAETAGFETFLMVGKIDDEGSRACSNWSRYNSDWVCHLQYDASGLPGNPVLTSFSVIDDLILNQGQKGKIWSVGNEPDWYPYTSPEDYAKWYHAFYTEIKKWDPTAKVMIGGLHSPNSHQIVDYLKGFDDHRSGWDSFTYGWIDKFNYEYQTQFGTLAPIDIYNIHDYPDDDMRAGFDPNNIESLKTALNQAVDRINYFREYMNYIGEQDKPLWITEFGLLMTTAVSEQDPAYNYQYQNYFDYFLKPLLDKIRIDKTLKVQRVFPFWTTKNDNWGNFRLAMNTMQERKRVGEIGYVTPASTDDMNYISPLYKNYISAHQDKTAPAMLLDHTDFSNGLVYFNMLDSDSLIHGFEWGYSNSIDSAPSLWYRKYIINNNTSLNYKSDPAYTFGNNFLFIRAFDAAGNISAPITVNIPLPPPPTATPKFYNDVPWNHWAEVPIDALYPTAIISPCAGISPPQSQPAFCPDNTVTRAQIAVYLLKSKYGPSYTPPPASGIKFNDIAKDYWAASWIEDLSNKGITAGCDEHNYCPENLVTRDTIPILFLRTFYGSAYQPNRHNTSPFNDVPLTYWSADWILQFNDFEIISGCKANMYCPLDNLTRAQLAVMLSKFNTLPSLTPTLSPAPPSVTPTLTPLPTPTTQVIPSNTPLPPSPKPTSKRNRPSPTPTGSF